MNYSQNEELIGRYLAATTEDSRQEVYDLIRQNQDKLKWDWISQHIQLSEDFIRKFQDRVNWYYITTNQILSEDFIREFQTKVDWGKLSEFIEWKESTRGPHRCPLKFIREFVDAGYLGNKNFWKTLCIHRQLPEDFIADYQHKVDWSMLSYTQNFSESFIRRFQNQVHWSWISLCQKLSEKFIIEFQDRVHWEYISATQQLSENFIRTYAHLISWYKVVQLRRLSDRFLIEFQDRIDFDRYPQQISLWCLRRLNLKVIWPEVILRHLRYHDKHVKLVQDWLVLWATVSEST